MQWQRQYCCNQLNLDITWMVNSVSAINGFTVCKGESTGISWLLWDVKSPLLPLGLAITADWFCQWSSPTSVFESWFYFLTIVGDEDRFTLSIALLHSNNIWKTNTAINRKSNPKFIFKKYFLRKNDNGLTLLSN